jgi:hypothetical protein
VRFPVSADWFNHAKAAPMPYSPAERRLRASVAGTQGWINTVDRAARGRHGQKGLYAKYLAEVPAEITAKTPNPGCAPTTREWPCGRSRSAVNAKKRRNEKPSS